MNRRFLVKQLEDWQPRWSPNLYKAVLVGIVAMAFVIPLTIVGLPFVEFLNDMAAQPKGKTQGTYGRVYGLDLVVERAPVPGTLPRDYVGYAFDDFGNTLEDAEKVGALLENPVPLSMANLEAGREKYETFCIVCHGKTGSGDGSVIGPKRFPAPPSFHTDQARGLRDGTIFHIVTKGMGKMPSYRTKLRPEERWQVIRYLRALQRAQNPQPGDLEK